VVSAERYDRAKVGAIIVAAGTSQRMGGVDKLLAPLAERPLLAYTLDAFQRCPSIHQIVVVLREQNRAEVRRLMTREGWTKVSDLCLGGRRRQDSVMAGLGRLNLCEWVVIHDGARPLVTVELIERGLEAAQESGAAVAAVPVTDTIKVATRERFVRCTPDRRDLWAVQTPQVFRFELIAQAYCQARGELSDDAAAVEQLGHRVKLYMGSYDNIKITTPADLVIAEVLLRKHGR